MNFLALGNFRADGRPRAVPHERLWGKTAVALVYISEILSAIGCRIAFQGQLVLSVLQRLNRPSWFRLLFCLGILSHSPHWVEGQGSPQAVVTVYPNRVVRPITDLILGQGVWFAWQSYFWDFQKQKSFDQAFEFFQPLGPGFVGHYPGVGVITHDFHWKNIIGPLVGRQDPTPRQRHFDTPLSLQFGPDEYGKLVEEYRQRLGKQVAGSIQVNIVNGTAEEAADWVEYMNASNDGSNPGGETDWAGIRAGNGHPEPYDIHYWELGNEPFFTASNIGGLTAWEYVDRINEFVPLMKERDPSIEVMAYVNPFGFGGAATIGLPNPDIPAGPRPGGSSEEEPLTWSQAVIRHSGDNLDLLYFHWFGAWNENVHDYEFTVSSMYQGLIPWLDRIQEDVEQYSPNIDVRRRLRRIAIPEWNSYGGFTKPISSGTALLGALANSRILHVFTQRPEIVLSSRLALAAPYPEPPLTGLGDLFDIRAGYFSILNRNEQTDYLGTAVHEMGLLWSRAFQPFVVTVETSGLPQMLSGVPWVDVTAFRSSKGSALNLVVTNAASTGVSITFKLDQYRMESPAEVLTVTGDGLFDNNTYDEKSRVKVEESIMTVTGDQLTYSVPRYSISAILINGSYPQRPLRRLQ